MSKLCKQCNGLSGVCACLPSHSGHSLLSFWTRCCELDMSCTHLLLYPTASLFRYKYLWRLYHSFVVRLERMQMRLRVARKAPASMRGTCTRVQQV